MIKSGQYDYANTKDTFMTLQGFEYLLSSLLFRYRISHGRLFHFEHWTTPFFHPTGNLVKFNVLMANNADFRRYSLSRAVSPESALFAKAFT